MGDFNAALFIEDTFHGSKNINISVRDFNDCVNKFEIADVNSTGLHYTWNHKPKGETGILKKIDRVMSNIDFNNEYPGSYAIFQPYRISDHAPALVTEHWKMEVQGYSMFQLVKKMRFMKKPFSKLLQSQGHLHDRVVQLRHELDEVQMALDKDPSSITLREEEAVYLMAFTQATLDEDPRVSRSGIDCITGHDNAIYEGNLVPNVFVQHYMQFFGTDNGVYPLNHEGLFVRRLSTDKGANMIRCVSDDEIQSVKFSIGNDKAPGPDGYTSVPDGYTSVFFKESWDVVGMDVCKAVRDFFSNGKLLQEINHTILSLLPKISTPARVNDYRPISCCNALDEFKRVSGLVPSIPKSTIFICNVLDHVKNDILRLMPFERGRRQLVIAVLSSMHLYWASVFILPVGIIHDIEQLMCGFLWCQGEMERGKAKVSWDDIDTLHWKLHDGTLSSFSVRNAWHTVRVRGNEVDWFKLVWSTYSIPRHAIHMWLVMRKRLLTQDRMRQWDVGSNIDLNLLRCPLCKMHPDSHDHLFFECAYSSQVWAQVLSTADVRFSSSRWSDIMNWLIPIASKNNVDSIVGRLIVAASSYFVWQERNNRIHGKGDRRPEQVTKIVVDIVRLKLASIRFKKKARVDRMHSTWKISNILSDGG
ncbi:sodium/hydrogen exchanger 6 [Tanacetum coccineum]